MTLPELLSLIQRHDQWVYAFLLAYCMGQTGPLPLLAGFAAAQGALRLDSLLLVTLLGSMAGGQIRFAVGWLASPWVYRSMPRIAPWVALASAGVERYSLRVLLAYRFVKGTFALVGLGAGASGSLLVAGVSLFGAFSLAVAASTASAAAVTVASSAVLGSAEIAVTALSAATVSAATDAVRRAVAADIIVALHDKMRSAAIASMRSAASMRHFRYAY